MIHLCTIKQDTPPPTVLALESLSQVDAKKHSNVAHYLSFSNISISFLALPIYTFSKATIVDVLFLTCVVPNSAFFDLSSLHLHQQEILQDHGTIHSISLRK